MKEKDLLAAYRKKRDFKKTAEPTGKDAAAVNEARFVVQEHHARSLHWDLRLERDGVLVSWAVPKGIPTDPRRNHLAGTPVGPDGDFLTPSWVAVQDEATPKQ